MKPDTLKEEDDGRVRLTLPTEDMHLLARELLHPGSQLLPSGLDVHGEG